MVTVETYPMRQCSFFVVFFFHVKVNNEKRNPVLPIAKFPFLVNTIMLQHLIHFSLYYLSRGRLREVKNKENFQAFSAISGRGRLQEVVAWKRFEYSDLTWKRLVF